MIVFTISDVNTKEEVFNLKIRREWETFCAGATFSGRRINFFFMKVTRKNCKVHLLKLYTDTDCADRYLFRSSIILQNPICYISSFYPIFLRGWRSVIAIVIDIRFSSCQDALLPDAKYPRSTSSKHEELDSAITLIAMEICSAYKRL